MSEEKIRQETAQKVKEMLESLTPAEQKAIRLHFGLGTDADFSSVTRQKFSEIEAEMLQKLRKPFRRR